MGGRDLIPEARGRLGTLERLKRHSICGGCPVTAGGFEGIKGEHPLLPAPA